MRSCQSMNSLLRPMGLLGVLIALGFVYLGLRGGSPLLDSWAIGLKSADAAERLAAVRQIENLGRDDREASIAALVKALHDPDARVRAAVAKATVSVITPISGASLGRDQINATLSALLGCLGDPEAIVRAEAAQAAWMVLTVAAAPPTKAQAEPIVIALIDRLGDGDPAVRLAAIRGLHNLGPKVRDEPPAGLLAAMDDEARPDRLAAARAVAAYRKALPGLLPSLVASYDSSSPRYREALLELVEQVHPPEFTVEALPGLVAAIENRDIELVKRAVADIARFKEGAGRAVPVLAVRLESVLDDARPARASPDSSIREAVPMLVESPGRAGRGERDSNGAVSALAKALRADREPPLRIAAAKALSLFAASPAQFAVLREYILDPDPAVRHAVIWAIHDVDYANGYIVPPALATALEDPAAQTRSDAAAAIGHSGMGADAFIPALVQHALTDPDGEVRAMCAIVIRIMDPPKFTKASLPYLLKGLDSPDSPSGPICEALGKLGREAAPAIPTLIRILREPRKAGGAHHQVSAVFALGRIAPGTHQSDEAVAALVEFLEHHPPSWMSTSIVTALARFGPRASGALPRLRVLQGNKDVIIRDEATKALSRIQPAG